MKSENLKGWKEFVGTEHINFRKKEFLSYVEAKGFMKDIDVNTSTGWKRYCKSGKRPSNIPSQPKQYYKDEWTNWKDFLGRVDNE